jgi:hypothetical protein
LAIPRGKISGWEGDPVPAPALSNNQQIHLQILISAMVSSLTSVGGRAADLSGELLCPCDFPRNSIAHSSIAKSRFFKLIQMFSGLYDDLPKAEDGEH